MPARGRHRSRTSVHRRGRQSGQRRWPLVLRWLIVITVLVGPGCGRTPPANPPATPSEAPARTAQIVQRQHLSHRIWDLMIDSPAVGGRVPVRLLLPRRFQERPEQQWPVLYLLHGCCDTYVSWTRSTDIERLSAHLDALVVMPDGGQVGFYSDWLDGPGWETFHTGELPQLLASEYRANGRAAIAGVSMGGLGALGYAARHPGQYAVAASFSGIVHTRLSPDVARGYLGLVQSYDANPLGLWGDPDKQPDVWKRHNPYDLAPQLGGTPLYISSGNGPAWSARPRGRRHRPDRNRNRKREHRLRSPAPSAGDRGEARPLWRRHSQLGVLAALAAPGVAVDHRRPAVLTTSDASQGPTHDRDLARRRHQPAEVDGTGGTQIDVPSDSDNHFLPLAHGHRNA